MAPIQCQRLIQELEFCLGGKPNPELPICAKTIGGIETANIPEELPIAEHRRRHSYDVPLKEQVFESGVPLRLPVGCGWAQLGIHGQERGVDGPAGSSGHLALDLGGVPDVIGVKEGNVPTPGFRDASVPRRRDARVLLP
jgi:hypothetical protein